jgi:hypothetical protein
VAAPAGEINVAVARSRHCLGQARFLLELRTNKWTPFGSSKVQVSNRPPPKRGPGRIVHRCLQTFIGHVLDAEGIQSAKPLKSLALPRGLEPLFSP